MSLRIFAHVFSGFPFDNQNDVRYQPVKEYDITHALTLTVALVDKLGSTVILVETRDGSYEAKFKGFVEVAGLERLQHLLQATDFTHPAKIEWGSALTDRAWSPDNYE